MEGEAEAVGGDEPERRDQSGDRPATGRAPEVAGPQFADPLTRDLMPEHMPADERAVSRERRRLHDEYTVGEPTLEVVVEPEADRWWRALDDRARERVLGLVPRREGPVGAAPPELGIADLNRERAVLTSDYGARARSCASWCYPRGASLRGLPRALWAPVSRLRRDPVAIAVATGGPHGSALSSVSAGGR